MRLWHGKGLNCSRDCATEIQEVKEKKILQGLPGVQFGELCSWGQAITGTRRRFTTTTDGGAVAAASRASNALYLEMACLI
jgi:hypothetical protein